MYTIGEFIFIKDPDNNFHYIISYNPEYPNMDSKIADIEIDSGVISIYNVDGELLCSKPIQITEFPFDTQTLFCILKELYKILRTTASPVPNGEIIPFIQCIRGYDFLFNIVYKDPFRAMVMHYPVSSYFHHGFVEVVNNTLRVLDGDNNLLLTKDIERTTDIMHDKDILGEIEYALICHYNITNIVR